jgi:glycosyltransferase AglE
MNVSQPHVSVVIPVLNGAMWIADCLGALAVQDYPTERFEVIVVDNGSTDGTREIVASHGVRLLDELGTRSPYAARNRGIGEAGGDVLAFTDADCVPAVNWLTEGVRPIADGSADLVGGNVRFTLKQRPATAELLDAAINIEMRLNIRHHGVAKTANLLAHRKVFDAVGLFPAEVRSGGDIAWTGRATAAGFRLVFAEPAEVRKRPRRLRALLKKQRRVGRGHVRLWRENGEGAVRIASRSLGSFLPRPPLKYRGLVRARGLEAYERSDVRLWLTGWMATIATGTGRLEELMFGEENAE